MKKINGLLLALSLALGLSGCASNDSASTGSTKTESPTINEVPGIVAIRKALLTSEEISSSAFSGPAGSDARTAFFEDVRPNNACRDSIRGSFPGLEKLDVLASQVISFNQELPTYIVQWVYKAESEQSASELVTEFSEKFLPTSCYETLQKDFSEKVDLTPNLPVGRSGFAWVDISVLAGDAYSQSRGIASVGRLVYFFFAVANDSEIAPLSPSELSSWAGKGMARFVGAFDQK